MTKILYKSTHKPTGRFYYGQVEQDTDFVLGIGSQFEIDLKQTSEDAFLVEVILAEEEQANKINNFNKLIIEANKDMCYNKLANIECNKQQQEEERTNALNWKKNPKKQAELVLRKKIDNEYKAITEVVHGLIDQIQEQEDRINILEEIILNMYSM